MKKDLLLLLLPALLCACETTAPQREDEGEREERVYITGSMLPRKKSDAERDIKTVAPDAVDKAVGAAPGGPTGK